MNSNYTFNQKVWFGIDYLTTDGEVDIRVSCEKNRITFNQFLFL